jgi:hypothetical protein
MLLLLAKQMTCRLLMTDAATRSSKRLPGRSILLRLQRMPIPPQPPLPLLFLLLLLLLLGKKQTLLMLWTEDGTCLLAAATAAPAC